jgi:hypothetical protein
MMRSDEPCRHPIAGLPQMRDTGINVIPGKPCLSSAAQLSLVLNVELPEIMKRRRGVKRAQQVRWRAGGVGQHNFRTSLGSGPYALYVPRIGVADTAALTRRVR